MADNKDKNKAGSKSRKEGLGFGGFGLIGGGNGEGQIGYYFSKWVFGGHFQGGNSEKNR